MSENLRLTQRDIAILKSCYRFVVVSFSQLHRWHFVGKSIPTISNRLTRLTRAGFIKKTRVGLPLLLGKKSDVGVVYETSRSGQALLQGFYPNDTIREEPQRLNLNTLAHDLQLNEALSALEKRYPDMRFVHGRLLPSGYIQNKKRLPDAVILHHLGKPYVAIELELTAKSEKRYREIILQYRLDSQIQRVLYITSSTAVSDKIKRLITNQRVVPGLPKPATGKFYFVTLTDLLREPVGASISNDSREEFLSTTNGLMAGKEVSV